ncbi:hypothetical protein JCM8547_006658 [Rhodosporidiobolus lusitaniae]
MSASSNADAPATAAPVVDEGIRSIIEKEMATLRLSYGAEAVPVSAEEALKKCEEGAMKGKVVVVTGGSKGFGKSYAFKAAKYGAKVVLGARGQSGIDAVVQQIQKEGGEATGLATDVSNWDDQVALFEHTVSTFGPVDAVIANAGIFEGGVLLEDKLDEKTGKLAEPDISTISINIIGTVYTSKLAFHYLSLNPSTSLKSLVILGSLTSYIPSPGCPLYCMSKHGLLGLQRSLSLESIGKGIDVVFVASAPVPTDIFGDLLGMIQNLPHGELDDTVHAMLAGSSIPGLNGKVYATDTQGIFQVPFKKALPGEEVAK